MQRSPASILALFVLVVFSQCPGSAAQIAITATTPPTTSSGAARTWISDRVPTALLAGPAVFFGGIPRDVVNQVCSDMVLQGVRDFDAAVTAYGATTNLRISLTATGGCSNPLAPAGIQMAFDAGEGTKYGVVCTEDAVAETGLCGVWLTSPSVAQSFAVAPQTGRNLLAGNGRALLQDLSCMNAGAAGTAVTGAVTALAGCTGFGPLGIFSALGVAGAQALWGGIGSCASEAASGPDCFSANALVASDTRGLVRMAELAVGERVAVSKRGSSYVFDTVYANGHADGTAVANFVRVAAEHCGVSGAGVEACSSRVLELTGGHFLPVVRLPAAADTKPGDEYGPAAAAAAPRMLVRAKDVLVGDFGLAEGADSSSGLQLHRVTNVTRARNVGLFNPYTLSGVLLVDGVQASCHSDWILDDVFDALGLTHLLPAVYQLLLSPLRLTVLLLGVERYVSLGLHTAIMGATNWEMLPHACACVLAACVGALVKRSSGIRSKVKLA